MLTSARIWNSDSICLHPRTLDVAGIAQAVYDRTCRTDFDAPGFCLVNVGTSISSVEFRQWMVDVKCEMARIHASQTMERCDVDSDLHSHLRGPAAWL